MQCPRFIVYIIWFCRIETGVLIRESVIHELFFFSEFFVGVGYIESRVVIFKIPVAKDTGYFTT